MIKNFCDVCGKEVISNYTKDADTFFINCSKCSKEQSGNDFPQEQEKEEKKEYDGRWERHARMEREHYGADILQPLKRNGEVNERFVSVYGAGIYSEMGKAEVTKFYLENGTPQQRRETLKGLKTGKMKPSQHLGYDVPYGAKTWKKCLKYQKKDG